MRLLIRGVALAAVLMCVGVVPAHAVTPSEFYANLFRRGVIAFDAGRYAEATQQLRIAAFGFVDSVEHYQSAQIYLALAYDRLGDTARARDAARRVTLGEKVERRYASLALPANVRSAFNDLSARLLTPVELAPLRAAGTTAPPQTQAQRNSSASTETTTTNPPRTTTNPAPVTTAPPRTTNPTPAASRPPATTTTTTTTQPPVVVDRVQVETQRAPQTTKPQTTQPSRNNPPAQTQTPQKPAPAPAQPQVTQPQTSQTTQPQVTQPRPTPPPAQRVETPRPATPTFSATEVATRLRAAERALDAANLTEARRLYRELVAASGVDHNSLVAAAEGLYRARDFAGSLAAFDRIGTLRRGEEPYRYYIAVALYETGQYDRARRELAAVLPYIEVTPDVARYRAKIEGAAR